MNDFTFLRDKNDSNMPPLNRAELLKWLLDWKGDIVSQMIEAKENGYKYAESYLSATSQTITMFINALQDDTMPFNQG